MATSIFIYADRLNPTFVRVGVNGAVKTLRTGQDVSVEDDVLAVLASSRISYRLSSAPDILVPAGMYLLTGSGSSINIEFNGAVTMIPVGVPFVPTDRQIEIIGNDPRLIARLQYGVGVAPIEALPANVLTFNGEPLTLNGAYLTIGS